MRSRLVREALLAVGGAVVYAVVMEAISALTVAFLKPSTWLWLLALTALGAGLTGLLLRLAKAGVPAGVGAVMLCHVGLGVFAARAVEYLSPHGAIWAWAWRYALVSAVAVASVVLVLLFPRPGWRRRCVRS